MSVMKFKTSDDIKLAVHVYPSFNERKVALFIAGIESYGGWYEESLRELQNAGVTCYFLDRRGSGESSGKRGDLTSIKRLIKDISELTSRIQSQHPGKPINLNAISWGAKAALAFWFQEKQNPFSKLILITPGIFRKVDLPFLLKIKTFLSVFISPNTLLPIPIPTESFTDNQQRLDYLEKDDLRLRKVTARFLKQSTILDRVLKSAGGIYTQRAYLFMSGEDRIVNNQKNLEFLKCLFFDIKTFSYEKAYHTLEFDEEISYKKDLIKANLE